MRLGLSMRQPNGRTLIQRAISLLRRFGSDAHLWLPGVGTVSGLTTGNYLESTGNTVLSVDNPAGLVLDALGTVGVELVSPLDFTTGWTQSGAVVTPISAASFSTVGVSNYYKAYLTVDTWYELTCTATFTSQLTVYNASSGLNSVYPATIVSGVPFTTHFKALATQLNFRLASAGTLTVSNISVREVSGIHASQATTQNKPILRRGLLNLLTYSSDFSNAAWGKIGTSVSGTKLTSTSGDLVRRVYQNTSFVSGQTYTGAMIVSAGEWGYCYMNGPESAFTSRDDAFLNLLTGALEANVGSHATVVALGGGRYLMAYTRTATASISDSFRFGYSATQNITSTGDGISGINIHSAALFQGALTAQQIIDAGGIPTTTSAAASNPSGGKYSWGFDGTNDSLALGSVPFQMGDDHCVVAGARCDSASGDRTVFGIRSTASSNPVIASLDFSGGVPRAVWRDDAGSATLISSDAAIATDCVLSNRKVGNAKLLRVNGVTKNTDATVIGTTTPTSAAIGVQPVASPSSYMQGPLSPVLAIKGTVTDAELLLLERFVASLTPGFTATF